METNREKKKSKVEKPVTILQDKNEYIVQIKSSKQALNHGLILKKVHKMISFNHYEWLKPYTEMNAKLKTEKK